eukprot:11326517-Alexandrium_andersonii.AAC.2
MIDDDTPDDAEDGPVGAGLTLKYPRIDMDMDSVAIIDDSGDASAPESPPETSIAGIPFEL